MQPTDTTDPRQEALDLLSKMTNAEIQAVRDLLNSHRQRTAPRKVTLTQAEMLAVRNLLRLMQDEFAEVEEGAGVALGTLDALDNRIAAALGIR